VRSCWWRLPIAAACACTLVAVQGPAAAAGAGTERVSVDSAGVQGDTWSDSPSLSDDGRRVAFSSSAANLVPNDTNGQVDVFVRDRAKASTERVNATYDGSEPDQGALEASISGDGRYVAFTSASTRLVPGDANAADDIFVRDLDAGTTSRVSVTGAGAEANGPSYGPVISADGRYVAFLSNAANLLTVDANGHRPDVFVHDRRLGTTNLVSESLAGGGRGGNRVHRTLSITSDGRYVAFYSSSTDLVADGSTAWGMFARDLWSGATTRESLTATGTPAQEIIEGSISTDGRFITFDSGADDVVPGDTNGYPDIFLRDRVTGRTELVSVATSGKQGDQPSSRPVASDDGRCVAYFSFAATLVPNDGNGAADVFVRDRSTGTTTRISTAPTGGDADDASVAPAISPDGRHIAFTSYATDLVPGDTNRHGDAFIRADDCGL